MSERADASPREGSCVECLRRSWLLALLGPVLDRRTPDRERLFALLELPDAELIEALAGSRRAATHAAYTAWRPPASSWTSQTVCPHGDCYPRSLSVHGSPRALHTTGPPGRLAELAEGPVVALLGARSASDYGREMATGLARGLSACGVTVVASAVEGIGRAALAGALQAGSRCVAVCGDGLAVCCAGAQRGLLASLAAEGCALSELPADASGRMWGWAACERLTVGLAQLAVLVECAESRPELRTTRLARQRGIAVGAVPGRASSPLSAGPHALLREGASVVCGAEDALELLRPLRESSPGRSPTEPSRLEPGLQGILDDVGAGRESAGALALARTEPFEEILLALTELELRGLLRRGQGGLYVRCIEPARWDGGPA